MLKRPLQIWIVFALALALAVPAMVLVTVHSMELDHARNELLAQAEEKSRQALLQDLITATLWRMDSTLAPLIGPETTRPYVLYQPFLPAIKQGGKKSSVETQVIPSPLLENPSRFVVIHFQVDDTNRWSSPQSPPVEQCSLALSCGVPAERLNLSSDRLRDLRGKATFESLDETLPREAMRKYVSSDELLAMQSLGNLKVSNPFEPQSPRRQNTAEFENLALNQLRGYPTEPWFEGGNLEGADRQSVSDADPAQQQEAVPQNDVGSPSQMRSDEASAGSQDEYVSPTGASIQQSAELRQQTNSSQFVAPQQSSDQSQNDDRETPTEMNQAPSPPLGRGGKDWVLRHQAYQSYSDSIMNQQELSVNNAFGSQGVVEEGIARWTWLEEELILVRRVIVDGRVLIQGCWIDWPALKAELLSSVVDLAENVDLQPIRSESEIDPSMSLATIPAALIIPDANAVIGDATLSADVRAGERSSPIAVTLTVAWLGFLLATTAVGLLLMGVVRLSERRAAFVSAVTHELRTPLTTFRMYAEMLSRGMVREERRKQEYLETLQVEADRLTHLVENVLAYSRLERGRPYQRREKTSINGLMTRMRDRFEDRAAQAEMQFVLTLNKPCHEMVVETDPAAVEQILFNLVENACKYARQAEDRRICLTVDCRNNGWQMLLRDYGPGIRGDERRRLFEPFSKSVERAAETAPGVGLGLALCRRLAQDLGGRLQLVELPNEFGACFRLTLPLQ